MGVGELAEESLQNPKQIERKMKWSVKENTLLLWWAGAQTQLFGGLDWSFNQHTKRFFKECKDRSASQPRQRGLYSSAFFFLPNSLPHYWWAVPGPTCSSQLTSWFPTSQGSSGRCQTVGDWQTVSQTWGWMQQLLGWGFQEGWVGKDPLLVCDREMSCYGQGEANRCIQVIQWTRSPGLGAKKTWLQPLPQTLAGSMTLDKLLPSLSASISPSAN